jgi:APA family basic amino acid/polyamine antiporter
VPVLGILSCVALMLSLSNRTWGRLAVWIALGLAIYALYGRRHSKLRKELARR